MSDQLFTVAPSPHIHQELTVPKVMQTVVIAMLPALAMAVYNFGAGALYVTALSVVFCVATEYVIVKYLLKKDITIKDSSAIVTGMLLAFNVPSNLPWHIILIGSVVAMGLGKLSFGGLGNNPFNPALVGRVFLLLSFPVQMTRWPLPGNRLSIDGETGATVLGLLKEGLRTGESVEKITSSFPKWTDFLLGLQGGSLGEMSALALLLGFGFMLYRKVISWHIPVTMIATVFLMTGIFWLIDPHRYANPVFHILTGGVMLGAIFMATDYVTSPFTHKGMVIFALGIGIITVVIRLFGSYPEGVSFAILIMNAFVPLINKYAHGRRFGEGVEKSKT
ncbi:MAG TPA: RnfABCDGE type electron transport complex subunit D [Cyclobacteriaceae bacterium]|nr:RnfABCDGE type electron transport complex subunit D [Cyclobacteriaceae bacterium]